MTFAEFENLFTESLEMSLDLTLSKADFTFVESERTIWKDKLPTSKKESGYRIKFMFKGTPCTAFTVDKPKDSVSLRGFITDINDPLIRKSRWQVV